MSKETWATLRPTDELIALYEAIKKEDPAQDLNRQATFDRAMRYVVQLEDKSVLKAAATQQLENVEAGDLPSSLKIRVDEALFKEVSDIVREVFQLGRVKIPFLMRVTLMAYLQHVRSENKAECFSGVEAICRFGIDPFDWKQVYEVSTDPNKGRLYELSRAYLETVDLELNERLREMTNRQIQGISDYYNIYKHFPEKRGNFAKTNIVFISKVLAGLILGLSEMVDPLDVEDVMEYMEKEIAASAATPNANDPFWKNIIAMPEEQVEASDPKTIAWIRKMQGIAREIL